MTKNDLLWYAITLGSAAALMGALISMFTGGFGFMVFAFISVMLLGLRETLTHSEKNQQRQSEMQQLAGELNFSFQAMVPVNEFGWSKSFHLPRAAMVAVENLDQAAWLKWLVPHLTSIRNVLTRDVEDMTITVFDFKYSENEQTHSQTVVALQSPDLQFRHFALLPATGWDSFISNFRENVLIRDGLRLVTDDAGLSGKMDDELFHFLDDASSLEAGEGMLLLYQRGNLATPHKIELMVKAAIAIHALLADSMMHDQPPAEAAPPLAV